MVCDKNEGKEKEKKKIMYLGKISDCKKFIHHYFNIYIYICVVYKYNILNKYK